MSWLLDVMTAMEIDDDPLILINPLTYATMACSGNDLRVQSKRATRVRTGTAKRTVLYLMLPSITIVELLKLIPRLPTIARRPSSRANERKWIDRGELFTRPGTKRAVTPRPPAWPIKKSRERAFNVRRNRVGVDYTLVHSTSVVKSIARYFATNVYTLLEISVSEKNFEDFSRNFLRLSKARNSF